MKFKFVIGFDMSKEFFDVFVDPDQFHDQFSNDEKGIKSMLKIVSKLLKVDLEECLFCIENTGLYCVELVKLLSKRELKFAVIPAVEIKRSLGIQRGKNDKTDASRTAEYGRRYMDKIKLYSAAPEKIEKLQRLLSLRSMHVKTRASYKTRLSEMKRVYKMPKTSLEYKSQAKIIKSLDKEIVNADSEIMKLIEQDETLNKYFNLLISIKGVGMVTACAMIVKTRCFTLFNDWRKFASFCGTAPFENSSGKHKGKSRISKMGHVSMKTLLTQAAKSAMLHDPELKAYREKKLNEGKLKKQVINNIRNKLLARIFSVAKRQTPYVVLFRNAA